MITGFSKFKETFQGFENPYVVIGETACDLLMDNEDMTFRVTKDIDIVLGETRPHGQLIPRLFTSETSRAVQLIFPALHKRNAKKSQKAKSVW